MVQTRTLRRFAVTCLLVGTTGCAALMIERLPAGHTPPAQPRCGDNSGPVVLDGMLAVLWGLSGLVIAGESGAVAAPMLLLSASHGTSAYFGGEWVAQCRKAREEQKLWLRSDRGRNRIPAREEASSKRETRLPVGGIAGRCFPDGTCNAGLSCNETIHRCVRKRQADPNPEVDMGSSPLPPRSDQVRPAAATASDVTPAAPPARAPQTKSAGREEKAAATPGTVRSVAASPDKKDVREVWVDGIWREFWREVKR